MGLLSRELSVAIHLTAPCLALISDWNTLTVDWAGRDTTNTKTVDWTSWDIVTADFYKPASSSSLPKSNTKRQKQNSGP